MYERFLGYAALAVVLAGPAWAAEPFKSIHVDDLAPLVAKHASGVWIYDANPPSTRERDGVIPGAHLLSSFNNYDVAQELPPAKDAKLVFYCANTH
jgi:hypothetical protein